ncbi:HU family DNA-binding protein [Salmonella enterica]|nr:HU family DNA-binding protein [Salmonella enterica subsp. enterica serovar Typhimurium]
MTKHDLIVSLSDAHLVPRDKVLAIVNSLTDSYITDLLETGETVLHGIGKLKVVERKARQGRNPKTNEPIAIPAARVLKFQTTKVLKEGLNA